MAEQQGHVLTPDEAVERAISDYLHAARLRGTGFYSPESYDAEEERLWNKLVAALDRKGIKLYSESEIEED